MAQNIFKMASIGYLIYTLFVIYVAYQFYFCRGIGCGYETWTLIFPTDIANLVLILVMFLNRATYKILVKNIYNFIIFVLFTPLLLRLLDLIANYTIQQTGTLAWFYSLNWFLGSLHPILISILLIIYFILDYRQKKMDSKSGVIKDIYNY